MGAPLGNLQMESQLLNGYIKSKVTTQRLIVPRLAIEGIFNMKVNK